MSGLQRDMTKGGPVRGPGGPKEDKVPAQLSNGEYVLPYEVVKLFGKKALDRLVKATTGVTPGGKMQHGRLHAADGDYVDPSELTGGVTVPQQPVDNTVGPVDVQSFPNDYSAARAEQLRPTFNMMSDVIATNADKPLDVRAVSTAPTAPTQSPAQAQFLQQAGRQPGERIQDIGGGIARVGNFDAGNQYGNPLYTNVGTEGVTDKNKALPQANGYDGAADIASLQRTLAIQRQTPGYEGQQVAPGTGYNGALVEGYKQQQQEEALRNREQFKDRALSQAMRVLQSGQGGRTDRTNAARMIESLTGQDNQMGIAGMQAQNQVNITGMQGRNQMNVAGLQGQNQLAGIDRSGLNALQLKQMEQGGPLALAQAESQKAHGRYYDVQTKLAGTPKARDPVSALAELSKLAESNPALAKNPDYQKAFNQQFAQAYGPQGQPQAGPPPVESRKVGFETDSPQGRVRWNGKSWDKV